MNPAQIPTKPKFCTVKYKTLTDVEVMIDLDLGWSFRDETLEQKAVKMEQAVKRFREFLDDHRSQDVNDMHVRRIYKNLCSNCNSEWESYTEDDGSICCSNCGAELEKTVSI